MAEIYFGGPAGDAPPDADDTPAHNASAAAYYAAPVVSATNDTDTAAINAAAINAASFANGHNAATTAAIHDAIGR